MNRRIIGVVSAILVLCAFSISDKLNTQKVFSSALPKEIVIVDPGHGGVDGGATGVHGSEEKALNLEIASKLSDVLTLCGVNNVMTRQDDISIHDESAQSIRSKKISDMEKRVELVNSYNAARLISIHLNHFSSAGCSGAQVFYSQSDASKVMASSVQNALRSGTQNNNKRKPQQAGKNIYLLKNVNCPAILVECGFLSNPLEEKMLNNPEYQKRVAICIATGYLGVRGDVENEN